MGRAASCGCSNDLRGSPGAAAPAAAGQLLTEERPGPHAPAALHQIRRRITACLGGSGTSVGKAASPRSRPVPGSVERRAPAPAPGVASSASSIPEGGGIAQPRPTTVVLVRSRRTCRPPGRCGTCSARAPEQDAVVSSPRPPALSRKLRRSPSPRSRWRGCWRCGRGPGVRTGSCWTRRTTCCRPRGTRPRASSRRRRTGCCS